MNKYALLFTAAAALFLLACADVANPVSDIDTQNMVTKSLSLADSSLVTLVHGVPGATFDVFVNDTELVSGFMFGTVTDPMRFAEGTYWVVIAGSVAHDTLFSDSIALPGNVNISVVAHLTEAGAPTLSAFVNDLSAVAPGKGRLVVRHTAAMPVVDVKLYHSARLVNYFGSIDSLANPEEAQMDIRPGRYTATIHPAGTPTVAFGPATIQLRPHEAYILYAVGAVSNNTLTLLLQRIDLFHESPPPATE